jgi:hypothetical protein
MLERDKDEAESELLSMTDSREIAAVQLCSSYPVVATSSCPKPYNPCPHSSE